MELFKGKTNVVYEFTDDEKTEVAGFLGRLKELKQGLIGTNAVLNATLQAIAVKAGITDLALIEVDLDKMVIVNRPVKKKKVLVETP
jgi:hypothetical protein